MKIKIRPEDTSGLRENDWFQTDGWLAELGYVDVLAGRRVVDRSATFPAGDAEAAHAAFAELTARHGKAPEALVPA